MRTFKHPEQMTPGTIWKVKGIKGLRHLESIHCIGMNYRKWPTGQKFMAATRTWATLPIPKMDFYLDELYLLVEFEHTNNGWIKAKFLAENRIIELKLYEFFWDRAFRLTKRTRNPKKVYRLLFGKYDVDELKKKLGMVNK